MFEFLSAYLEKTTTPEMKSVVLRACEALVRNGEEGHVFLIDQQLEISDNFDSDVVSEIVSQILLPTYHELLISFGVKLDDDTTLVQAMDIFEALIALEFYEDKQAINDMCDSSEGPHETLADLLPLTGALTAAEYLELLDDVSDELIEQIAANSRQEVIDELPSPEIVERCRARLNRLLAISGNREGITLRAIALIEEGARIGLDYTFYTESQRDYLEILMPDGLAVELLALLLISNQQDNELLAAATAEFELLHMDAFKITTAHAAMIKLLSQVSNA